MATYPTAVRSFTNKVDGVDFFYASDLNSAYDEITAVESTLGVSPSVSVASTTGTFNAGTSVDYGTVKARLDNLELGVIKGATNAVQTTGGSTIVPSATNVVGLKIQAMLGQVADAFEVTDNGGNTALRVAGLADNWTTHVDYALAVGPTRAASAVALTVTGSTALDTVQIKNFGGTNAVVVDKTGKAFTNFGALATNAVTTVTPLAVNAIISTSVDAFTVSISNSPVFRIDSAGRAITSNLPYKMGCGSVNVTLPAGATSASVAMTLTGFSVAPIVTTTPVSPPVGVMTDITGLTSTAMNVRVNSPSTFGTDTVFTVNWVAMQGTSSTAAL